MHSILLSFSTLLLRRVNHNHVNHSQECDQAINRARGDRLCLYKKPFWVADSSEGKTKTLFRKIMFLVIKPKIEFKWKSEMDSVMSLKCICGKMI